MLQTHVLAICAERAALIFDAHTRNAGLPEMLPVPDVGDLEPCIGDVAGKHCFLCCLVRELFSGIWGRKYMTAVRAYTPGRMYDGFTLRAGFNRSDPIALLPWVRRLYSVGGAEARDVSGEVEDDTVGD